MGIEISHETEAWLIDEARRRGISVEALLQQLINERASAVRARGDAQPSNCKSGELPVWHLGGAGALHRRDIYDDAG
jgi:hypothetical protein